METAWLPCDGEHPELTPCPCGAEAVWYCVVLWPDLSAGPGQPVGALVANDFYADLCDACFNATVADGGEEERVRWRKEKERMGYLKSIIFLAGSVVAFALGVVAPPAHAQAKAQAPMRVQGKISARQRASLQGLRGFNVVVAPLPPAIEAAGLKRAAIQVAVEATLKKAGIPMYQKPDWATQPNVAQFGVTVRVQKEGGGYTVIVLGEVYQDVTLARSAGKNGVHGGGKVILLPTWRVMDFGVLGPDKLPRVVAGAQDAAAVLAADYATANGKPQ